MEEHFFWATRLLRLKIIGSFLTAELVSFKDGSDKRMFGALGSSDLDPLFGRAGE